MKSFHLSVPAIAILGKSQGKLNLSHASFRKSRKMQRLWKLCGDLSQRGL